MGILDALASGANLGYQIYKDQHLTGAEREANEFTASQTQAQMDFQERMANTQYQRGVADMVAAGVNPALAISQGGNVAPSGSSGSSVDPGRGVSMSELLALQKLSRENKLLEAQASNVDADTANKQADTLGKDIANMIARQYGMKKADADLQNAVAQLSLIKSQINETDMRALYEFAQSELASVQKDFVLTEKYAKEWENAFIDRFHVSPALAGDLIRSLSNLGAAALHGVFSKFGLGLLLK